MQTPKFLQELISSPEHSKNTCDECSENNGTVFENKEDVPDCPVHPNCRCWVEEVELNEAGKKIGSKVYKGQKPEIKPEAQTDKETEKPTFEKPVNVKPGQYAVFDGKKFTLFENDKPIMSWDACRVPKAIKAQNISL